MKILLIGEYSNVHATLAEALRANGHQVTVASNGDFWKNYPRDIDLSRAQGKLGGIRLIIKIIKALPKLRGYDVVQLINPIFVELKAKRIAPLYRYLRRHNRRIVLGAFGMDHYWVSTCINNKPLRYSDFNMGDQLRYTPEAQAYTADWMGTDKETLNRYIATDCDAIVAGLYEYLVCYQPHFPEKTSFIPFPIKPTDAEPRHATTPFKLHIFIGINKTRSAYKGTDIMLRAAQRLKEKHPDSVCLQIAESVPFAQYEKMMDQADVILDQLYSYTPAMNGLLAMSKGIVCVGGGEPENYEVLGESQLRPIINVEPTEEHVFSQLESLVDNPALLTRLSSESLQYIDRHHHYLKVARRYEQLYRSLLQDNTL